MKTIEINLDPGDVVLLPFPELSELKYDQL
jgi:hypothetical protein